MRPQVKKIIILSIVFSLAGIITLGAGFWFLYVNGVQKSQEQLAEVKVKLEEYRKKRDAIPMLEEQLRQVGLRAQKAKQQIPPFDENEFDNFLNHLRSIARSTGTVVKPPKVVAARSQKEASEQIVRASYDLSSTGDFKRLWDFLKVMESSIRFVEIENFMFAKVGSAAEGGKDATSLTMRISVFAFRSSVLPPPKKPTEVPKEEITTPAPK